MRLGFLSSVVVLTLFFRVLVSQEPNTDGFFVSDFLQKMGRSPISDDVFNFSTSFCSWQGVFCDFKRVNVIRLVASNLGLFGPIPESTIGKLAKLEYLDLSCNRITGFSSDFWMESLDLSYNEFSGEIPAPLSSLSSIQVLNLGRNRFNGSIPSGILNCQDLVSIDISSNRLNGTVPDGLGSALPKLKSLNLAGNEIRGRSADLSGLESITYLNISMNLFQGSVMGVFEGPLEVIDLSENQFQGHISQVNLNSSFDWSRLIYFDVSTNELSGKFYHDLSEAHNLKHLNLANNKFFEAGFPPIENLSSLEYLNLSKTGLKGEIPNSISKLSALSLLDLSNNHLFGHIPKLNTTSLQVLDLSMNNLTGEIPFSLVQDLSSIHRFNFSYNNLTICASNVSLQSFKMAFIGSTDSCPIAANPERTGGKAANDKRLKLALAITISIMCLLMGLMCLAFGCRRKTRMWAVKQCSHKEEASISGPFSFQTDSTTWVADVKLATSVPVVVFEKPLLNFTFADLLSATSHFDRGTLLAEGRCGPVYRALLPGGIHVAVKVLVHGSTMTDQEAARELEYLGRIKHPNLVPLAGYCLAGDQRIVIYDYMENGNLQNLLHDLPLGVQATEDWSTDTWEDQENNASIQNVGYEGILTSWKFRHKIALGTARALAFLHHGCSPPIIHRDVKASSVYLDPNLEARLSDFGLAKIFGNGIEDVLSRGSPGYIPPEFSLLETASPTPKSDVYGFGVVLFELITGKKPIGDDYSDDKDSTLVAWVRALVRRGDASRAIDPKIRGTGPEAHMEEALRIGYLCTADLPAKRPSMQQIVGLLKDIEPVVTP
ncbi:hypothetical protein Sjap_019077 [Stephania japonica]|uniref:Protein kinase domain-containing protein n=1 Tax=Stephania japonica TaxID=461633 RepID=A0AAP0F3D6_9MAGN